MSEQQTQTMVERVARAIDPGAWEDDLSTPTRDGVISFHKRRQYSCVIARAVIEAMREPTSLMLKEGAAGSGEDSEATALGAWDAMIDAALAET